MHCDMTESSSEDEEEAKYKARKSKTDESDQHAIDAAQQDSTAQAALDPNATYFEYKVWAYIPLSLALCHAVWCAVDE